MLVTEGDLYIHSIAFLWLLLAEGLGISMGYWWLVLEPRILPRKGRPKWGTVLGPGAGEGHMRVRSRRLLAVEIRQRAERGIESGVEGLSENYLQHSLSPVCPRGFI